MIEPDGQRAYDPETGGYADLTEMAIEIQNMVLDLIAFLGDMQGGADLGEEWFLANDALITRLGRVPSKRDYEDGVFSAVLILSKIEAQRREHWELGCWALLDLHKSGFEQDKGATVH